MGKQLDLKNREVFLKGMYQCFAKGAQIIIDKEEAPVTEWERIFEVGEDGSCYMADYVDDGKGRIIEIRFDKVRNE